MHKLFYKLFRHRLDGEKIWRTYLEKSIPPSPSRLKSKYHNLMRFCSYYNDSPRSPQEATDLFVADIYREPLAASTKRGIISDIRTCLIAAGIKLELKTPSIRKDTISHQAFTLDELKMLIKNSSGWTRHLLITGVYSGLRKKDICLMEWGSVNLDTGWINQKTYKTGATVKIPILPPLRKHLGSLPKSGKYVYPDLAQMYEHDPASITYYFVAFLRKNGIETRIKLKHRRMASNLKGIHSLRHTFVYLAAVNKIPWPVIQSITGHASRKMLQLYMNHATEADTMRYMSQFPDIDVKINSRHI